jgi:hypothetical protein
MIKSKPTPEGFKIWAIANEAFILDFLFHVPGQQAGAGPQDLRIEVWKHLNMCKTNLVILELATRLRNKGKGYCI